MDTHVLDAKPLRWYRCMYTEAASFPVDDISGMCAMLLLVKPGSKLEAGLEVPSRQLPGSFRRSCMAALLKCHKQTAKNATATMLVPTGPDATASATSSAGSFSGLVRRNPSLVTRRLQEERRRVGLTIGRKRLLQSSTAGTNNNSANDGTACDNDDRLLFRRGDDDNATASNNFLEIASPYKAVAFLRDDLVLASDDNGRVDAVRLPNTRGGRGTLVASRMGDPDPTVQHSAPALFSLNDGDSFAMGLSGGEVRVFATSRDTTWSNLGNSNSSNAYMRLALRASGPRRKYERAGDPNKARSVAARSLSDMLKAPCPNDRYLLQELCDWNEGRFPPSRIPNKTNNLSLAAGLAVTANSFAFHEDSSSRSLFAAYVDPEFDCFSLRVLDGRISSETTDVRRTICLDTKPLKNRYPNRNVNVFEDISAITFIGDRTLATSHVARVGKNQASNIIKLWDLRMVREEDPKPASSAPFIPSFPFDEARGIESWRETAIFGRGNAVVCPMSEEIPTTDFVISRLVGSVDGCRLSITTNSWSNIETFDGHRIVDSCACNTLLVDPNQMNNVVHDSKLSSFQQSELNAFTPNLDFLASYQDESDVDPVIMLFDLNDHMTKKDSDGMTKKKRKYHDTMQASNECTPGLDSCLAGKLDGAVTDVVGIQSKLSCLSLDKHGTALVGASMDGDLFLWG